MIVSVRFSSVDSDFCVVSERYSGRVRVIGDDGCDVRVVEFGSVGVFPSEPLFVIHKSVGVKGDTGATGATGAAGSGTPATATPLMNGTAAVGASTTKWAREDHVHPSDTNKATFLSIPAASIPYRSYGDGSSGEPNWYLTPIESSTANTIMRRDGSGRSQIEAPSADKDIANKKYVDDAIGAAAPVDVLAYAFGGF